MARKLIYSKAKFISVPWKLICSWPNAFRCHGNKFARGEMHLVIAEIYLHSAGGVAGWQDLLTVEELNLVVTQAGLLPVRGLLSSPMLRGSEQGHLFVRRSRRSSKSSTVSAKEKR